MNTTEHLLTCLSEECVEVSKDIHKALRFGLADVNVLEPNGQTNRERIIAELNDLMATIELLMDFGVLPRDWANAESQLQKRRKVRKFMAYAHDVGALQSQGNHFDKP